MRRTRADVYAWCMTRTNIDIDDELVAAVMEQNGLKTKREAVDFALRRAVRRVASVEELVALEGSGFDLDLDEIRNEDLTWVDKLDETKG